MKVRVSAYTRAYHFHQPDISWSAGRFHGTVHCNLLEERLGKKHLFSLKTSHKVERYTKQSHFDTLSGSEQISHTFGWTLCVHNHLT